MIDQFFTPTWAAELLFRRHFADAGRDAVITDPSCGDGRFLMAIPDHIDAYGVEIDPAAARKAMANSGREVLVGDFRDINLPRRPTAIIGNPPFRAALVSDFLERAYEQLEYGGRVGFILPVYIFQASTPVMRYAQRWSLSHEMIPRNLFQGLSMPLMFATFIKARQPVLSGFFLYAETASLEGLRKEYRRLFAGNDSRASVWRETVYAALKICGGQATLEQIYQAIENNRPTPTKFWREQIRKVAGLHYPRVGRGMYSLPEAA